MALRTARGSLYGSSIVGASVVLGGCAGPQSTLDPAGLDAAVVAELFWWMTGAGFLIWSMMVGLTLFASSPRRAIYDSKRVRRGLIVGGTSITTLLLVVLLLFGLRTLPALLRPGEGEGVTLRVSGEQWWWRVEYTLPNGERVASANEIRIPRDRRTRLELSSPDVIHSLWVPSLGGKLDMIPGRTTTLGLEPIRSGIFYGVCAEYCGSAHTQMQFRVVVLEPDAYARWLQHEAQPAASPRSQAAQRGAQRFLELGCGACHAVRGTPAHGLVGPDLTHVGSRMSLGAGILNNEVDDFEQWLRATATLKPGVHMPTFDMLDERDISDLALYLDSLQ